MGTLVYEPPRNGPTLWEIGIPDRSAAEFYVPDPNPQYVNKLFLDQPQKFVFVTYSVKIDCFSLIFLQGLVHQNVTNYD